jgi:hypothetical protein
MLKSIKPIELLEEFHQEAMLHKKPETALGIKIALSVLEMTEKPNVGHINVLSKYLGQIRGEDAAGIKEFAERPSSVRVVEDIRKPAEPEVKRQIMRVWTADRHKTALKNLEKARAVRKTNSEVKKLMKRAEKLADKNDLVGALLKSADEDMKTKIVSALLSNPNLLSKKERKIKQPWTGEKLEAARRRMAHARSVYVSRAVQRAADRSNNQGQGA